MSRTMCQAVLLALVLAVGLLAIDGGGSGATSGGNPDLTRTNPSFVVTAEEAQQWHRFKDDGGPTFSGSEAWHRFMAFVEARLKSYGVVDIARNRWSYDLWSTSEWPDDSRWRLVSDAVTVKVAHYAAWSGATGPEGVTASLVCYNPSLPPESLHGKIVVFPVAPHPKPPLDDNYKTWFTLNDYEHITDAETFPPLFTPVPVGVSVSYDVWWQLRQTARVTALLQKERAVGGLVVFDMPYDRVAGLYTFPVPALYNVPTLYLDRNAGRKVLADCQKGAQATLTLQASVKPVETYQLIGYLPGRDYGTDRDERVLLRTHTDGPAISQENGAFGILGLVAYFSRIPRQDRPRTLMVYLDNRHYMPGMEEAFKDTDWFAKHPDARRGIVGLVALEHLGQREFKEEGEALVPTGRVEPSFLWTRSDRDLIDQAIQAVKDHRWPRVLVQAVERAGTHGGKQGVWYGMGRKAVEWNLPAFSTMGAQGAYWSTAARLDKFDKDLFRTQVAVMARLTGVLMTRK